MHGPTLLYFFLICAGVLAGVLCFGFGWLFFISGYFTPSSLERRRGWRFLQVKARRLLVPWAVAVLALIPHPENKLLERRGFRRALCFGIDRRRIVDQIITGGREMAGFPRRVSSWLSSLRWRS